jgi:hypothetical protein
MSTLARPGRPVATSPAERINFFVRPSKVSYGVHVPMKSGNARTVTFVHDVTKRTKAVRRMQSAGMSVRTQARRREIESLRRLKQGWFDGEGERISRVALDGMSRLLARLTARLPEPRLYATPHGAVRAEWDVNNRDISIEISATGFYAHVLDHASGEDREAEGVIADEAADFLVAASA